jgi:predicted metalloprotease with PDZ domain
VTSKGVSATRRGGFASAITHRVTVENANAHRFRVTLSVPRPAQAQVLRLPVWIPGSYLVREFARHWSAPTATQGKRRVLIEALDKNTWVAHCEGEEALEVSATVVAHDPSVRTAWLDSERGFFNGTSMFLMVEGRAQEPQHVLLEGLPRTWRVATSMPPVAVDARGQGRYAAQDYDELVDHPFELGEFWRGQFVVAGVPHEFVVSGARQDFDGERLLADTRRICQTQIAFWHGRGKPPHKHYAFLLNVVGEGHGGLEHRASTALICSRHQLPREGDAAQSDAYTDLLGLISHEYFHTWNVKRLRPAEFARYDYLRENYTHLLWFFEGFTSYYDDLMLLRSGRIDANEYLRCLAKSVNATLAVPGRHTSSVAQASFDAWIKFYRPDESSPNTTVSYYSKGALVALALDLRLRVEGHAGLDAVMRQLWQVSRGGPIDEGAIGDALAKVGGRSYASELRAWVHGTEELPLQDLLQAAGVRWQHSAPSVAQRLGVRLVESGSRLRISHVLDGGIAQAAGLAAGDEWLALDDWLVRSSADLLRWLPAQGRAQALVVRDQRVVRRVLALGTESEPAHGSVALTLVPWPTEPERAVRMAWLGC